MTFFLRKTESDIHIVPFQSSENLGVEILKSWLTHFGTLFYGQEQYAELNFCLTSHFQGAQQQPVNKAARGSFKCYHTTYTQ